MKMHGRRRGFGITSHERLVYGLYFGQRVLEARCRALAGSPYPADLVDQVHKNALYQGVSRRIIDRGVKHEVELEKFLGLALRDTISECVERGPNSPQLLVAHSDCSQAGQVGLEDKSCLEDLSDF